MPLVAMVVATSPNRSLYSEVANTYQDKSLGNRGADRGSLIQCKGWKATSFHCQRFVEFKFEVATKAGMLLVLGINTDLHSDCFRPVQVGRHDDVRTLST